MLMSWCVRACPGIPRPYVLILLIHTMSIQGCFSDPCFFKRLMVIMYSFSWTINSKTLPRFFCRLFPLIFKSAGEVWVIWWGMWGPGVDSASSSKDRLLVLSSRSFSFFLFPHAAFQDDGVLLPLRFATETAIINTIENIISRRSINRPWKRL